MLTHVFSLPHQPTTPLFFPASLLSLLRNDCVCVCVTKPYIGKHEPTDHAAPSVRTCANTNAGTLRGLLSPLEFVCVRVLCAIACKCECKCLSRLARSRNLRERVLIYYKLVKYADSA